jgi:hypothetical protein
MRKLFMLLSFLSLTGCGSLMMGGTSGLAQIDMLSVIGTDKTVIDHVISVSSGKNCSSVQLEKGNYFCEEDEPKVIQNIHCYKTLASVTCYDRPDPHKGGYQKVGVNDHNLIDSKTLKNR